MPAKFGKEQLEHAHTPHNGWNNTAEYGAESKTTAEKKSSCILPSVTCIWLVWNNPCLTAQLHYTRPHSQSENYHLMKTLSFMVLSFKPATRYVFLLRGTQSEKAISWDPTEVTKIVRVSETLGTTKHCAWHMKLVGWDWTWVERYVNFTRWKITDIHFCYTYSKSVQLGRDRITEYNEYKLGINWV